MNRPLSLALLATLTSVATAQEAHLVAIREPAPAEALRIGTIELDGGAVFDPVFHDVTAQLTTTADPTGVEWIGQEIWVSSARGIDRFVGSPPAFAGRVLPDTFVSALVPSASGAYAFTFDNVIELDAQGIELNRIPFNRVEDAIPYRGGFAVIDGPSAAILLFDAQFAFLQAVGTDLDSVAMAAGTGMFPERLFPLSGDHIGVGGVVSVGVIDESGGTVGVYNTGLFEVGVLETANGSLFIPAQINSSVFDPRTGGAVYAFPDMGVDGATAFSSVTRDLGGAPTIERTCSSTPNSTGFAGRLTVIGNGSLAAASMTIGALDVPPVQFGLFAFGTNAGSAPFGNGTLCISPAAGSVARSPVVVSDVNGRASLSFDFSSPSLGSTIAPGSTWVFQYLHRDPAGGGAGVNTTDAVAITFGS